MEALRRQTRAFLLFVLLLSLVLLFSVLFQQKTSGQKQAAAGQQETAAAVPNQQQIAAQIQALPPVGTFVYGKSGLGADLTCTRVLPNGPVNAVLLLTFEVHGYEDAYAKDGQVLVDIGHAVAQWAQSNRGALGNTALYLVASANPDGLAHGVSNNGVGRCQVSLGVNINRDFPAGFKVIADARDHTLSAPLAAPESRALADLVGAVKPAAVIDVHGWENHVLGDQTLASYLLPVTTTKRYGPFDEKCNGFFSLWASTQGARAALLELPRKKSGLYPTDFYISRVEGSLAGLAGILGK
ncbi:peptidase M14 [Ethanoligenens harbinense]|uniref:Peptidase M14 carboxypeptidase A n=1 Tax=Ethanoligenens harbinense (strain DSM 18485 / JCM 12961 / CGMCC 1.5033 / YUAN-3) TaxID=663278 RepID=E6U983_ETHHY|nr:peptidase M14 [Ethanoligenens harbinense]ADU27242.1 peptidase M14 carboxypeptidase A [Ethanoligenens harbinense YUAN-3]AVQ96309.1 hypothetical protein CXQ68_08805 [Ethanoligenens harbinense YUAN-3]AYF38968.1 hypothetical protein CXP51_08675 [Ethanoligenens harbinense]AYF41720.1 hypothetical protein CN246_08825 [Ethanoligenens harbinense]QCN92550.1 hypothetical protein DRA42_08835 [Ethanoligenens harbinense]